MNLKEMYALKLDRNIEKEGWHTFLEKLELLNYIPDKVKSSIQAQVSGKIAQCDISIRDLEKDIKIKLDEYHYGTITV